MERMIYKYRLSVREDTLIPTGRVVLVAQRDNRDIPTIWVEHSDPPPEQYSKYAIVGTGQPIEDVLSNAEHVGSAVCGAYVWHVYRQGE